MREIIGSAELEKKEECAGRQSIREEGYSIEAELNGTPLGSLRGNINRNNNCPVKYSIA